MLYVWRIKILANYGPGTIVVESDSEETAREIARDKFDTIHRDRYDYLYYVGELDSDDLGEKESELAQYLSDISRPAEIHSQFYTVNGSE